MIREMKLILLRVFGFNSQNMEEGEITIHRRDGSLTDVRYTREDLLCGLEMGKDFYLDGRQAKLL